MATENDNTQATGPGSDSPGHPAGEPEAPTGPATTSPRAADAAKAYATAESHVPSRETKSHATAADGNGDPANPAPANAASANPAPANPAAAPASAPPTGESQSTGETTPSARVAPADGKPEADQPEDHERKLELDLEELSAKAEKADEYLELAKRTKADFENYRKRAAREAAAAQERGIAKLAKELLPAIDNLDRAVQAAESAVAVDAEQANGAATLVSGVKLVHADVLAALQRAGIERFSPQGESFDPQRHEAIAQTPVEGAQPGTIVEVYQQGYLLGEAVIRPARVVVAG